MGVDGISDVDLAIPRDAMPHSSRRWCTRGRAGERLYDMSVSLDASGDDCTQHQASPGVHD